jgi:hypothetical protein
MQFATKLIKPIFEEMQMQSVWPQLLARDGGTHGKAAPNRLLQGERPELAPLSPAEGH